MSLRKHNKICIQQKLEHKIIHGLSCEWEKVLGVLNQSQSRLMKKSMKKPLISIKDMKSRFGFWSAGKREICISRNFVLNYSWNDVRDLLLHEMAHQFAGEVLNAANEPPHGPSFQKACELLRANPKSTGNYKPLSERIFYGLKGEEDKITLRIKKLMALAESKNQHEAEAAMAKAYELISKYNLTILEDNKKQDFCSMFIGTPALRHPREEYHLAHLLQDYCFVYGLWISAYVLEKGKMGGVLEISGEPHNLKTASYVYDFIKNYINSQWTDYNKDKRLNRYRKTDFSIGIINGFCEKLESEKKNKKLIKDSLALVNTKNSLLKKYTAHRYPYTQSFRHKAVCRDETVLHDGMRVGEKLIIFKGITTKKDNDRKPLLTI